ncbi:PIN domain-containing protein [Paenibacillus aurantiacus]|uniref:PIN domain-containing protein n=1 Tax=Paenibacillus aurantiacus TaxID=1936118 RepID=A0ABV5KNK6_9BACL
MAARYMADANLIIRFLANDDPTQSPIARKVFQRATEGVFELLLPDIIVMEICWVLKSRFNHSRKDIARTLIHLCESENMVTEGPHIVQALEQYGDKNVDLADALLAVKSKALPDTPVLTWNIKDFRKLSCEYYSPDQI